MSVNFGMSTPNIGLLLSDGAAIEGNVVVATDEMLVAAWSLIG